MNWFDEQLTTALSAEINAGLIQILPGGKLVSLFDYFPFSTGRLQWSEVPGHRHEFAGRDAEAATPVIRAFLGMLAEVEKISSSEWVIYEGDACDCDLRMRFETFVDCCGVILSTPQHHYLSSPVSDWCWNYTFEGDIYFGRTSEAIVKKLIQKRRHKR
jgi:hypothetical protein